MELDKKPKPCHPIILPFNMDPEQESIYFSCIVCNGAVAGDGQPDISKLSLVIYCIYTNKHFWESAHFARHLAQTCSCAQVCYASAHALGHAHRLSVTHSQIDTHTINRNGGGAFLFFFSGHSHKQGFFKVSGKVPPSFLPFSLSLKE